MNQPKFRFGDNVTNSITNEKFTVKAICQDVFGEGFAYSGDLSNPSVQIWHNEAALHLEPKPYFYRSKSGAIGVFDSYQGLGFHCNGEVFRFVPDNSCREQEFTGMN